MTFPSAAKKSGPNAVSKTGGAGVKNLSPGSPRSPGSPQIMSAKLISPRSSVKPSSTSKVLERTNVESTSTTSVKKLVVPPKSPAPKSVSKPVTDAKLEPAKTSSSFITNEATKTATTKPPPLKLNTKTIDPKGLQSPKTPKSVPKTPTTPSKKSLALTKSPVIKAVSAAKSGVMNLPSPITKSSQASTVSSPVTKSPQVTTGIKSTSSLAVKSASTSKSSTLSSTVTKSSVASSVSKQPSTTSVTKTSTTMVTKISTTTSVVPKSPLSTKPSTPTLKSSIVSKTITSKDSNTSIKSVSKDHATIVKPTTPVKKSTASIKSGMGVKIPTTPSKSLAKEPSTVIVPTPMKTTVPNKSSVVSKSGQLSPKVVVKKESSTLSLLSVKSTSTIKSTSSIVSKTTSKTKVTMTTSVKNVVPKSPVAKTQSLSLAKTPSSPTTKNPSTSVVKAPLSPAVKTKTPSSPSVKSKTPTLSSAKPPLSPVIKKMVPTKLILSPGLNKSKSLSSSRLSSVSTESLASRTSLKSPMSPKPIKFIPKSPLKVVKKTVESQAVGIRGRLPIKKTIEIAGISELPSNLVPDQKENCDIECGEIIAKNASKEELQSTITQMPDKDSIISEQLEMPKIIANIDNGSELTNNIINEDTPSNVMNAENVNQLLKDPQENDLETIDEDSIEHSSITPSKEKHEEDKDVFNSLLDFVVVNKEECVPRLNSISQSVDNCGIAFNDNHFSTTNENVLGELNKSDQMQSCVLDMEDHFEPMNDKLVLGDVPFESDVSDNEQADQEKSKEIVDCDEQKNYVDSVFSFAPEDLTDNDFNTVDSTENFIHQFMPKSVERSEGASSISTDDGSLLSRKSYSEAVSGSPNKDGEYYFDYDFELVDDCLDCDDEERSVFVEVTEKEFPELKPKDLSGKRRRNKKQKKRNYSNRSDSQSDYTTCELNNYNPQDFDGNEFCHYINMMKDCSFYPNGFFSTDSVKLSTSSSLSWLDISVRTTDDDLLPSTECLSTYEIFQASNLNKDFLTSIIGSTPMTPTNETTWFWKSIEGRHQTHNKANITLSLQPRPKHLTTPRFMTLLALISEAKGYEIKPMLSEHFVTTDCMLRFDDKISRLMVQGFWLIGRLIKESLSDDEEINCGNPFGFVDGDIGFWWAGINMLDWQEYIKECGKSQLLPNCYQFVIENMDGNKLNSREAVMNMNAVPDDFLSELDMENFVHTVRNVKYYCGNCFVDSQENLEAMIEENSCDNDSLVEWEKASVENH